MTKEQQIFKAGSRTYYTSSYFFPANTRQDITKLYAFVRTVDDFIDTVPQQVEQYKSFKQQYYLARQGQAVDNKIINDYQRLERQYSFKPEWTDAFLTSMDQDLEKKTYLTIEEVIDYMYGSAEVVGLMVARIIKLPAEADQAARMLGRAMQYINFIRDIAQDHELGRTYLPIPFAKLTRDYALGNPQEFNKLIRDQIDHYKQWQTEAVKGYNYIPKRFLIPIKTASDMYQWTAEQVRLQPDIVFTKKVKPGKLFIIFRGLYNVLTI